MPEDKVMSPPTGGESVPSHWRVVTRVSAMLPPTARVVWDLAMSWPAMKVLTVKMLPLTEVSVLRALPRSALVESSQEEYSVMKGAVPMPEYV